ncbi:MAG: type II toxin-antitoxin system VapC family toxin [Candidatus Hadarchaeota archaeon]|nr:type II toxin-antitoxin system VapC family toxin [Candidatus Hadarchaeota archaeon]
MICLDTDFLIALLQGNPAAKKKARFLDRSGEVKCTTPVNMFELYLGAYLSRESKRNVQAVHELLSALIHLTYDEDAARLAGEFEAKLESEGRPIGLGDVMVAGTSKRHDCRLLTRDEHFTRVKGLKTSRW